MIHKKISSVSFWFIQTKTVSRLKFLKKLFIYILSVVQQPRWSMDNFLPQMNEQLLASQLSNESFDSNSTVASFDNESEDNQLIENCVNVPSENNEPSFLSSNQAIDKFEVTHSKDVHIGTSYHCASVHVYEAVPSNFTEYNLK